MSRYGSALMTEPLADNPVEWVEARLEDVALFEPQLTHAPNAVLKGEIARINEHLEALNDIVKMLAREVAALRNQSAPPR